MAKLLPYIPPDPADSILVLVHHIFTLDPYEPGTYHTIYPYTIADNPPATWSYFDAPMLLQDAGDLDLVYARGIVIAHAWAGMPWMILDLCGDCHYTRPGPHLPRWNIMRGGHKLPYPPSMSPYAPYLPPCFAQKWDDPRPPGV